MAGLRVRSLTVATDGTTRALRVSGLRVLAQPPAPQNTLLVSRLSVASGAASPPPTTNGDLDGLEPWDAIPLTGSGGGAWRQVSGPPVTLVGTGSTRYYYAPGTLTGVALGFQYAVGGVEVLTRHIVLPVTERTVISGRLSPGRLLTPGEVASLPVIPANPPGTGPVDPIEQLYKAPQTVDGFVSANPELAPIARQPQAKWIGLQSEAEAVGAMATAADGRTLLLTVYAVPNRDSGGYSAGGFTDRAAYLNFCSTIAQQIGTSPAVIIYEPDALGLANAMSVTAKAERIETLRRGLAILAAIPNAEIYVDASMWIGLSDQGKLLQAIGIEVAEGICINTSAYAALATCYTYGEGVLAELSAAGITGKRYVVDTSRNGVGPLSDADRPLASPWLDAHLEWCNPPKRRLGLVPQVPSGRPNCRALLWIKNPGESDGTFPTAAQSDYYKGDAPSAGAFWLTAARMLIGIEP